MIVDSHQHFWQVGQFDYPWMTPQLDVLCQDYLPATLESLLAPHGVGQTILVQASNSAPETEWLLSLAENHPFIAGVVGWVDLQRDDVDRELDQFTSHSKFKGVRHLVESEPADDWLTQRAVLKGLDELARRDLSYDLLVHTRHLRYVRQVVEKNPQLRFVIDHVAKPPIKSCDLDQWAALLKEVAQAGNVCCKLSGLVTEADWANWRVEDLIPYVDKALEYFGPARLMFGSDWPVCLLAASYGQVLEAFQTLLADLSDQDRELIFSKNAAAFYRLQEQAIAA